ncbi:CoA-transferase family III [Amylocystis lapponica]|nr:CoA-transferase family III [Amylocystis lapponica]
MSFANLPLSGVKVVEFAGIAPGPMAGMMLADFGADVVRVDRPSPSSAPPPVPDMLCRGKRSIAIDPKVRIPARRIPSGNAVLRKLISRADVLIDPFRPGVMERIGLGPEVFLADGGSNKRLVYSRLVGFSRTGPHKNMAGHDLNYLAVSGVLSLFPGAEKPSFPLNILGDFAGGSLTCVLGILLALLERQSSGLGQVVNTDMVNSPQLFSVCLRHPLCVYVLHPVLALPAITLLLRARGTNLIDGGTPYYDIYTCADGRWMSVACIEPQFFRTFLDRFCSALPEGFALDNGWKPTFAVHGDRWLWPQLKEFVEKGFRLHPRDHWAKVFHGTDACAVPVLSPAEAAAIAQSTCTSASVLLPNPHPDLSRTPAVAVQGIAPDAVPRSLELKSGRHTQDVLDELGMSEMEKQKLEHDGALGTANLKAKL